MLVMPGLIVLTVVMPGLIVLTVVMPGLIGHLLLLQRLGRISISTVPVLETRNNNCQRHDHYK